LRFSGVALPLRTVHATRGKWMRAEPVAIMYAQGKVKHVDPPLVLLEDEMADFGLGGLSSGAFPDRLDALVWAVTELMGRGGWQGPQIRSLGNGRWCRGEFAAGTLEDIAHVAAVIIRQRVRAKRGLMTGSGGCSRNPVFR
jgi:hypothetical protein